MPTPPALPREATLHVRDACLCLHVQRAARALARRFDEAFRPLELTNWQFSLMMSLNRPGPRTVSATAALLGMDRTTLTAALKPLERHGLIEARANPKDRRSRVMALTPAGEALLVEAVSIWKRTHAEVEAVLENCDADRLRRDLVALSAAAPPARDR